MFARVVGGTVAAGAAGAGYAYYWAIKNMGEDAVDRLMTYSKVVSPAILAYKLEEARCGALPEKLPWLFDPVPEEEQDRRFAKLHEKWAPRLRANFMQLGGFYYKSGQKIASNAGGVWPKLYTDTFQVFLNDIPARSPEEVRAVVEAELGQKREEVFSEWDDKPIGCASIGQVHRATLRSNGQRVVVKVQNPDAERTFRGDVFSVKIIVDAFMPQFSLAFDEIAKQFKTEFDYRGECQNAVEVRDNLRRGGFDNIIVPEVFQDLCTRKVLVMEEVYPSTPLHDALDEQAAAMAKAKGISKEQFMEEEKARVEEEARALAKHGKVVEAVSSSDYAKYIALQKTRQRINRGLKTLYNYTAGWVLPNFDLSDDGGIVVPLNAAQLVDDLMAVHGHECLLDGCMNADPHPGNILCADGKLALIDYGQVKRLSKRQRLDLCKSFLLVDAAIKVDPRSDPDVPREVHERAVRSVVEHSTYTGMRTEHMRGDIIYDMMTVWLGRMDAAWVYPRNIIQWSDWIQAEDPLTEMDKVDYFVLVSMATMMLRGLGDMLQQPRNLAAAWAPYARQALAAEGQLEEVEAEIASWREGVAGADGSGDV